MWLLSTWNTCYIIQKSSVRGKSSPPGKDKKGLGLPWWRSGWESACRCRGHGFGPWSRKIPHAAEQLGPWATITEPARLEAVLRNKRGRDSERLAHRDEKWPPLAPQLEKALAQKRRPNTAKKKERPNTNITERSSATYGWGRVPSRCRNAEPRPTRTAGSTQERKPRHFFFFFLMYSWA